MLLPSIESELQIYITVHNGGYELKNEKETVYRTIPCHNHNATMSPGN